MEQYIIKQVFNNTFYSMILIFQVFVKYNDINIT